MCRYFDGCLNLDRASKLVNDTLPILKHVYITLDYLLNILAVYII